MFSAFSPTIQRHSHDSRTTSNELLVELENLRWDIHIPSPVQELTFRTSIDGVCHHELGHLTPPPGLSPQPRAIWA